MACLLFFFLSLVLVLPDSSNHGLLFQVFVEVPVMLADLIIWFSYLTMQFSDLIMQLSDLIILI